MNSKEAQDVLKLVKIDEVSSDKANIVDGSYKFWSWGHMYTKGEPTGLTKDFIDYILSEDVQENIVGKLGYISISSMQVQRDWEGNLQP